MKPDNNQQPHYLDPLKRLEGHTPKGGEKADDPQQDHLHKPLYSIKETAGIIGMSKAHVERLLQKGELRKPLDNALPGTKKHQYRIKREAIREYLKKREQS